MVDRDDARSEFLEQLPDRVCRDLDNSPNPRDAIFHVEDTD